MYYPVMCVVIDHSNFRQNGGNTYERNTNVKVRTVDTHKTNANRVNGDGLPIRNKRT